MTTDTNKLAEAIARVTDVAGLKNGRPYPSDLAFILSAARKQLDAETRPTTGTLAEIGAKIGDRVELMSGSTYGRGHTYTIQPDGRVLDDDWSGEYYGRLGDSASMAQFRIIPPAQPVTLQLDDVPGEVARNVEFTPPEGWGEMRPVTPEMFGAVADEPEFKTSRDKPKKWSELRGPFDGSDALCDYIRKDGDEIRVKRTGNTFSIKRRNKEQADPT